MLAANVQCAGVGGDCRSQTGGGGGRLVFNPAHHQLQQVCEGQLKLHRCNAMRARPHVEPGWAADGLRLRAPPRPRPLVPVDFSPLRRGALWPERLNPQVLWQMKEQEGRQQPGELWSLLGPRLQGSPPLRHCAQVLSVSSWWWWPEQLSVGELRSNWTQIGAITPPKNATNSYTTLYRAAVYPCSKTVELLSNFLKKKKSFRKERTKGLTFHLALAKFFSICAHTFSLMFLSEAAPPEILLHKTGEIQLHNRDSHYPYLRVPRAATDSITQFAVCFIDWQTFLRTN